MTKHKQFKVKAAHRINNGDIVSCEAVICAATWEEACKTAADRLLSHSRSLARRNQITLHKVKAEKLV